MLLLLLPLRRLPVVRWSRRDAAHGATQAENNKITTTTRTTTTFQGTRVEIPAQRGGWGGLGVELQQLSAQTEPFESSLDPFTLN